MHKNCESQELFRVQREQTRASCLLGSSPSSRGCGGEGRNELNIIMYHCWLYPHAPGSQQIAPFRMKWQCLVQKENYSMAFFQHQEQCQELVGKVIKGIA